MIFGGLFLGSSFFQSVLLPQLYENFRISGNAKFGFVKIVNHGPTDVELDAINLTVPPVWGADTLLMATFDSENTGGGNITGISSVEYWGIYRLEASKSNYVLLDVIDGSAQEYIDYTVENHKSYRYQVVPISGDKLASVLQTSTVNIDMNTWYLIDELTNETYKFSFNLETGEITNNANGAIIETGSQYPTYVKNGNKDYDTGQVSVLIGESLYGEFTQLQETIDNFKAFINNGNVKILKSKKGKVWKVRTDSFRMTPFETEGIHTLPYKLDFRWIETQEV